MSLRTFLRTYREEIDRRINQAHPGQRALVLNEKSREAWIRRDEALSSWARSLGVKL